MIIFKTINVLSIKIKRYTIFLSYKKTLRSCAVQKIIFQLEFSSIIFKRISVRDISDNTITQLSCYLNEIFSFDIIP